MSICNPAATRVCIVFPRISVSYILVSDNALIMGWLIPYDGHLMWCRDPHRHHNHANISAIKAMIAVMGAVTQFVVMVSLGAIGSGVGARNQVTAQQSKCPACVVVPTAPLLLRYYSR